MNELCVDIIYGIIYQGKENYSEETLSQCQIVHHKSHIHTGPVSNRGFPYKMPVANC